MKKHGFDLKKALFGKLNRKIIIMFAIVAIALTGISIYTSYNHSKVIVEETVMHYIETTADSRTNHVVTLLQAEKESVGQMAESIVIKRLLQAKTGESDFDQKLADVSERLENTVKVGEYVESILVLDKNGMIIASSNKEDIGTDKSGDPHFFEAKKEIFIKDAYFSSDRNSSGMDFSAPIFDNEGKFLGVVVERVSTKSLNQITTDRTGFGETGEVYIVNKYGYMITPSRFQKDTFLKQRVDTENAKNCFSTETTTEGYYTGYKPAAVSNGYRKVQVVGAWAYIPEMQWCLLAEIDKTQAFDPAIKQLGVFAVVMFAIMIFAAVLAGSLIAKSISKPVEQLQGAAEQMKKGNFDVMLDIKTGDELGKLGTAFNETAKSLGQVQKEHRQLERAKTEFLSITSHELRSPMTPMKAQLQMLKKSYFGKLNKKQTEAVDIVLRNTSRLDSIIMDFLEISRIEAARLKFRFVKTSLTGHIKRLADEMQGFLPEKNIEIVIKIAKMPVIKVDPDRVMQVLRNLINNAKKFSPKNSKIIVSAKLKGNRIQFNVKDQGSGIAKENKARVFEPFFQEEQTMYRKHTGTGLGLSICKGIVESQKGNIWVKSTLGKGSTFSFTLPLTPVKKTKPIKLLFSPPENIEKKPEK